MEPDPLQKQKHELQSWLKEKEALLKRLLLCGPGHQKEANKLQKAIDKCKKGRHGGLHAFMSVHIAWSCKQFDAQCLDQ